MFIIQLLNKAKRFAKQHSAVQCYQLWVSLLLLLFLARRANWLEKRDRSVVNNGGTAKKIWCFNLRQVHSDTLALILFWRPYRITDRYCFETFVNCPAVNDVPEPPCWWSLANFCKERKADNDSLTNFLMTGEYKLKNQKFGVPFTNSFWPKFKISISKKPGLKSDMVQGRSDAGRYCWTWVFGRWENCKSVSHAPCWTHPSPIAANGSRLDGELALGFPHSSILGPLQDKINK